MLPYLIVGQGIAGTMLSYHLTKAGASVRVLDQKGLTTSSRVAAGLYNPVTGKRMVKTWLADTLFPYALQTYKQLEQELNIHIVQNRNVYKPFKDIAEQNDLLARSSDKELKEYIHADFDAEKFTHLLHAPLGGIEVLQAGNIELNCLLDAYRAMLVQNQWLIEEAFDEKKLVLNDTNLIYDEKEYKGLILCQGAAATQNSFFNYLPFSLTKGEILEIEIPDFPHSHIVSKGFFILPKSEKTFLVGSTYELNTEGGTTEKGLNQLKEKLNGLLQVPYNITGHRYGIRPTVRDRRPFIGKHPKHSQLMIFNGFGTKGVTLTPYFAKEFVDYLLFGNEINKEANIERYYTLY